MSAGVIAAHYAASGGGGGGYATAVMADAPLFYGRLGEASGTTMVDSSGNGRNGTYSGAPVLGAAGLLTGDADTAVRFTGSNYATVPFASWLNAGTFTIEAIIKYTVWGTVLDRDQDNANRSFQWFVNGSGRLESNYWVTPGGLFTITGATALTLGQKYHVAMTHDGSNVRLYVNGVQDAVQARAGTVMASTNSALQIAANRSAFNMAQGTIDEVAYYGTALSATRLAAHYAAS